MIKFDNLGYHTDCIARKLEGEFLKRESYSVLRMPSNPTFYWGNLVIFKNEPKPGDFEKWISIHIQEFGEESGHVTFGWESQRLGSVDQFIENGFTLDSGSVLVLENLSHSGKRRNDLEIREIVSDKDWDEVLKMQVLVSEGDNPSAGFVEFKERSFETYKKLSKEQCGAWWGAFMDDRLVGDMGLYFDDDFETGRFQSVETHPDHRRKGVCSQLLHFVADYALESHPNVKLVICTDQDSDAEEIYNRIGFKQCQVQYGVCLERPLCETKFYSDTNP